MQRQLSKEIFDALIESLAFDVMAEQPPGTTTIMACSLCWLSPAIKAQETVMTRIDVGLAGSLYGLRCLHVNMCLSPPFSANTVKMDESEG